MTNITQILHAIERGEPQASRQLWPVVYGELKRLAQAQMSREKSGHTLNATALVHEAYLRLAGKQEASFANRRHFYGAAAEAMRRILVEAARRKSRIKHGGGVERDHIDIDSLDVNDSAEHLLTLDEAMKQFAIQDPQKAKLVELRFFGGLSQSEAAECLGISISTADRAWRYARAWLYAAVSGDNLSAESPDNEIER